MMHDFLNILHEDFTTYLTYALGLFDDDISSITHLLNNIAW